MSVKPISPNEIKKIIPDFVVEAVNELIAEKVNSQNHATVLQKHIVDRVKSKTDQDFDYAWLDFENVFRDAGWNVNYDKPAYCESYDAFFEFSPKRGR